jgi:ribosomal protein S18 acetylase RimI-like enzyme
VNLSLTNTPTKIYKGFSSIYNHDLYPNAFKRIVLFWWLATQEKIVGMIELVGNSHISLLFVDGHLQRIGIGKELLKKSLKICRRKNPALKEITVNSSPNAVNIYKKIAFSVIDSEKEKNNIRFVAMNPEISNSVDTLSAQL